LKSVIATRSPNLHLSHAQFPIHGPLLSCDNIKSVALPTELRLHFKELQHPTSECCLCQEGN
jgi:hypothetical protein